MEVHSTHTMAKSFGSFRKRSDLIDQQKRQLQEFWKFVKIDVETLVKKMDADHPNKWDCLDEVVKYLTDIQRMRDHHQRVIEEVINQKSEQN